MADKFLTLLEIAKLGGQDPAVGLIEEVTTYAPELMDLMGRPINGISYRHKKRTVLPRSSGGVFRNANEGSDLGASTYEETLGSCYFVDVPLQIDEATVTAGVSEGASTEQVLASEAAGAVAQSLISVGDQFYRGTTADAKGFAGLQATYDSTNCEVSATGSSGAATSAWLIWNAPQGVHWVFGNGNGLQIEPTWLRQQVRDASNKVYFAYVNNVRGYVGLSVGHSRSVVRIKLITAAKPLTDQLIAQALLKMPVFMRRTGQLRLLMNSNAQYLLQNSRSTVNLGTQDTTNGDKLNRLSSAEPLRYAPPAIESNGVPIILTDSIPNNE
jgi:hypothetical protein